MYFMHKCLVREVVGIVFDNDGIEVVVVKKAHSYHHCNQMHIYTYYLFFPPTHVLHLNF